MVGKAFEEKRGVQSQERCFSTIADFFKISGLSPGFVPNAAKKYRGIDDRAM